MIIFWQELALQLRMYVIKMFFSFIHVEKQHGEKISTSGYQEYIDMHSFKRNWSSKIFV